MDTSMHPVIAEEIGMTSDLITIVDGCVIAPPHMTMLGDKPVSGDAIAYRRRELKRRENAARAEQQRNNEWTRLIQGTVKPRANVRHRKGTERYVIINMLTGLTALNGKHYATPKRATKAIARMCKKYRFPQTVYRLGKVYI